MSKAAPDMVMPFGKHQGKTIEELPTAYLTWMAENFGKDKADLVEAAEAELEYRYQHGTLHDK